MQTRIYLADGFFALEVLDYEVMEVLVCDDAIQKVELDHKDGNLYLWGVKLTKSEKPWRIKGKHIIRGDELIFEFNDNSKQFVQVGEKNVWNKTRADAHMQ